MFTPRDYQTKAIADLWQWFRERKADGIIHNPLLDAPTGAGKSILIAMIVRDMLEKFGGRRVLVLTHQRELIEQNHSKLMAIYPESEPGIYSASIGKKQTSNKVLFCGIQSVYNKAHLLGDFSLILIDEAHLIPKSGSGMYRRFIADMNKICGKVPVIGLTATPYRLDSGYLHKGKDALFTDIAVTIDINELLDAGYLAPLTTKQVGFTIDASMVKKRGGEFITEELEKVVDDVTEQALQDALPRMEGRKTGLAFCVTVKHAQHVSDWLNANGVSCAVIHGETPKGERDKLLKALKAGAIRCLANVNCLTTGIDVPNIDYLIMLRPTQSPGLYVQMAGRGLRIADGKTDCIASDQLVLTDTGLIPIQLVTKSMKVWDGVEFVSHSGVVYKGKQKVITYAGITATEDHKVWTKKGWKTIRECASKQIEISVTGIGRQTIQQSDCYYRRGDKEEFIKKTILRDEMHRMWECVIKGIHKYNKGFVWLQKVWAKKKFSKAGIGCSKVDTESMYFSKTKMYEQKRSCLHELWSKRSEVFIQNTIGNGSVFDGNWTERSHKAFANRQDRQQWELRERKHKNCSANFEHEQPKIKFCNKKYAFIQRLLSRNKICRFNNSQFIKQRNVFRGNSEQILQNHIHETKREVWDILNAGPRNRFTCQGLLVSNCLVLDYAGNINRHGPIDKIEVRQPGEKRGEGEAPVKVCPECESIVHASLRFCPCGYQFPPPVLKIDLKASAKAILSKDYEPEWHRVDSVKYSRHPGKDGKPDTMRVDYYQDGDLWPVKIASEFICVFHPLGWAKSTAEKWWNTRSFDNDFKLIDGYIESAQFLAKPVEILMDTRGKYSRILEYRFDDTLQLRAAV